LNLHHTSDLGHSVATPARLYADAHLLRAAEAARWARVSKSTWYAWVASGRLPRGIKLSPGVTVWDMEAVAAALSRAEAL
jgi:Predicted transcriptional regulator